MSLRLHDDQVVEVEAAEDAVALVEGLLRGALVGDEGVEPRPVIRHQPGGKPPAK